MHISSKLNSAFSAIGKATANKITALAGKTHAFAFALKEHYHVFAHAQEFDFRTGG